LLYEIVVKADEMYREQIEEEPPVELVWADWLLDRVADPPEPDDEEDNDDA
jgi:hypothetical protein